MGRTIVTVELSNYRDIIACEEGRIPMEKIRRVAIPGVVDTGAARLVLPKGVVELLGLPADGQCTVRYADHRREVRDVVKDAHIQYLGRGSVFDAIVEPNREDALLGAIVLESLDLIVDCVAQKLLPREPDRIFAEIE
jgi:predicted aspartyl protease